MEEVNPRLHDLKGVYSDFRIVLNLLNQGYRFDDEDAPPVLLQLEKALQILKREIGALEKEWD